MNPTNYLVLSAVLFAIGGAGVLVRRNAIVVFMCIELMLNAANLAFVTFARINGNLDGMIVRSSSWSSRPPRSWSAWRSSFRSTRPVARPRSTTPTC